MESNGSLWVGKDFIMQGESQLQVSNSNAKLSVDRDVIIDATSKVIFSEGALELGGDFQQSSLAMENSLSVSDDFSLIFNGEEKQQLQLAYPETTRLGSMDFRESAGVEVPEVLYGKDVKGLSKIITGEKLCLDMAHLCLMQDEKLDCDVELQMGGQPIYYYVISVE